MQKAASHLFVSARDARASGTTPITEITNHSYCGRHAALIERYCESARRWECCSRLCEIETPAHLHTRESYSHHKCEATHSIPEHILSKWAIVDRIRLHAIPLSRSVPFINTTRDARMLPSPFRKDQSCTVVTSTLPIDRTRASDGYSTSLSPSNCYLKTGSSEAKPSLDLLALPRRRAVEPETAVLHPTQHSLPNFTPAQHAR